MGTFQDFAQIGLMYGGNELKMLTSVKMTTDSGQQPVDLLNEGLSGFTPGSGRVTVDIGYAVPIGGPEAPYQQDCAAGSFVTLQVFEGALSYIGKGKIINNEVGQSTNNPMEGSCQWMGPLAPIEI